MDLDVMGTVLTAGAFFNIQQNFLNNIMRYGLGIGRRIIIMGI